MTPHPPRSFFLIASLATLILITGCPKDNPQSSAASQSAPTLPQQSTSQPSTPPTLIAPTLLSPEKDAALHGYPRTLNFQWSEVPGATSYGIEIDCYGCGAAHMFSSDAGKPTLILRGLRQPAYTHDFVGDQPGRWRVWAANNEAATSVEGPKSEWRQFTFGRVIDGNIIPPPPPPIDSAAVSYCPGPQYPSLAPGTTPPRVIYNPNPEYTEAARKKKLQGNVILRVDVGADGLVKNVCVVRGTEPGLDERAVSAVRTWRFEPARKDGAAVPYVVNIETSFNLR